MLKWYHTAGGVGIVLLLVLFIWGGSGTSFSFLSARIGDVFSSSSLVEEHQRLQFHVEELKNVIAQYELGISSFSEEGVDAKVFSLYPFNTKQRIYIDKGSEDGIEKGFGVVVSDRLLIGEVSQVFLHTSEVMTIFDSQFSLPVRIGKSEVDALFEGGVSPHLSLIDKSKNIKINDLIFSADRSLPYGLSIGYINAISEDSSGAFLTSSVTIPYNVNDVRDVKVLSSYDR